MTQSLDWGIGLLVSALGQGLHLLIWRRKPAWRRLPLLLILLLLPSLLGAIGTWQQLWPVSPSAWILSACLSANYIAIYPAFQAASPTLQCLAALYRAPRDWSESEIQHRWGGENILSDRVRDLEHGGFIRRQRHTWQIAPRGRWLARTFRAYRWLLGLPQGDGG